MKRSRKDFTAPLKAMTANREEEEEEEEKWQLRQRLKWTGFRFISFYTNTHFQYEYKGLWPLAKTDRAGVKSVHLARKRFLISAICHLLALTALKLSCQRPPEQAPRDDCQVHGEHSPTTHPPTHTHTHTHTHKLRHLSVEQRTAHWWLGWRVTHTHTHTPAIICWAANSTLGHTHTHTHTEYQTLPIRMRHFRDLKV